MQKTNNTNYIRLFIDECKKQNLKVTPQRISVYRAVINSRNHPTADEIFKTVQTEFPNISFDTVNRTLLTFSKIDIVNIVESYTGARRFDSNLEKHHHVHCIHCGEIIDFHCDDYDNLNIPEDIMKQFQILSKRVVINAICAKCQERK